MDMRHLQYFLEVARWKSFTKAAQSLYITQPTISKMVKNLEEELGVVLFDRIGKRIELTDAGTVLLTQAQHIVTSFEEMTSHLDELMKVKRGRIRIGLPPMVGASFFPKVIGEFREQYPEITLQLYEHGSKKVEAEVGAGELDIGVILLPTDEEVFDSFSFVKQRLMLVVHPSHRLAGHKEAALIELKDEPFLMFHEDFALHDRIIAECGRLGFEPLIVYKSSQWDFISEMAAANLGIALLPETICRELDEERLRMIPLTKPTIPWHLAMIWRKNSYLSYAAKEWIAFTQRMLRQAPHWYADSD
ncbi:LysR substrate-binding domain-containing protein [Paenibacillus doosanensis]|uniref:HTH-type transcriptional regulator CynR n=1 Tax=Paenibacillus konkukensis TaxID=2020716 RepID=A0ABY4RQH7_9BACL|nr:MULTISPECIES: LysR family transcriptional regulator [Paenibacillus]MCS7459607.1 LysR substrate-binding domain-containing protein [Paenibacillus doosanensis]UQZ84732.1 HTH-type transcriptional regulator CynR [Paenibacillus konkukensis]